MCLEALQELQAQEKNLMPDEVGLHPDHSYLIMMVIVNLWRLSAACTLLKCRF